MDARPHGAKSFQARAVEILSNPRNWAGVGAFLGGFALIILAGQTIFPSLSGMGAGGTEPMGIYLRGTIVGLLSALLALGLVLVYRTDRIINFAQGSLGGFAATLTSELYQVFHWPYLPAILVGIVAAVGASMFIEWAVIRRFHKAPRLILTVATIGVAQILGAIELLIPYLLNQDRNTQEFKTTLASPLDFGFDVGGVPFQGDHLTVLIVAPLVLIGLFAFLRYSRYGVAARGIAENRDRARLLGVRVSKVALIVWAIAGLLSALTAILRAPILGFTFGAISGVGLLFRALAAAVIGRMENLPVTVAAAILLTTGEQTIFWYFGPGPAHGFLLAVIGVALLAQRSKLTRVDAESSSWQAVQEVRPIPTVMRHLPEVRWGRVGTMAALGGVLVLLPFMMGISTTRLVSVMFIYGMIGISLVMLTGWGGHVSLGHWAIVGFGALTAGKLASGEVPMDFFLALLAGALVGAMVSLIIGLPALRIRGLFLGVTTLALAVAGRQWFFQWEILTPDGPILRPVMFGLWDVSSEHAFYYVALAALVLSLVIGRNVRRSRLGRLQVAMRDNEAQAQSYGVRPVRMKLLAFATSGFIAGLAGAMYAYHEETLAAGRFEAETSLAIFSMVVIGGMGSMTGGILGAVYVRGIQFFLSAEFQLLATGFGLLILLLIFPGGLAQILFGWRDRILRRLADRRGMLVPSLVADRRQDDTLTEEGLLERAPPVVTTETDPDLVGAGERP